ncbi:MAG: hypothetical protein DLM56_14930 [Pseudonocardiales bacterium]|nr:MAG: hypothetical protein DLM56_14930 [Pseudonocardiales bacterium]
MAVGFLLGGRVVGGVDAEVIGGAGEETVDGVLAWAAVVCARCAGSPPGPAEVLHAASASRTATATPERTCLDRIRTP